MHPPRIDFSSVERFEFTARPVPVPADLRPVWMTALVLLALRIAGRGDRSSMLKLYVLRWTIEDDERVQKLLRFRDGSRDVLWFPIRPDPFVTRAVSFAAADGLCETLDRARVVLTSRGRQWADAMMKEEDVLADEIKRLRTIGKSITEQVIERMAKV